MSICKVRHRLYSNFYKVTSDRQQYLYVTEIINCNAISNSIVC